jgi:hypothetical protein
MTSENKIAIRQQPCGGRKIGFTHFQSYIHPELIIELQGNINTICLVTINKSQQYIQRKGEIFETLVGTKIQSPRVLSDPEDGVRKLFFVFHDLSIRIAGEFVLELTAVDMDTQDCITKNTNVISVVSPQQYAGIGSATQLSRSFSLQGVPMGGRRYRKQLQ